MDPVLFTAFVGIITVLVMVIHFQRVAIERILEDRKQGQIARIGSVADNSQLKRLVSKLQRRISELEDQLAITVEQVETEREAAYKHGYDTAAEALVFEQAPDLYYEPQPEPSWESHEIELDLQHDPLPPAEVSSKWWMTPERPVSWTTPEEREAHDKGWTKRTKEARKQEWTAQYA